MSNNHPPCKRILLYLLFFSLFILTRVVYLDADLPSFNIFNYQPIDEFWYNNLAFNLYRYSDIQNRILPYVESDSLPTNIFQNLITYISLEIFGNNYYGLRMASVIASLGVFLFFYCTIRNYDNTIPNNLGKKQITSRAIIVACMIYLVFDFSFLLASRISEPTIFRMLSLAILMYFYSSTFVLKHLTSNWFTLASGFIAFASVLYIYPSNAFLVPTIWGLCIYGNWDYNIKRSTIHTLIFLLGGIICLVTFEIILRIFFGKSYVDELSVYASFLDRVNLPGLDGTAGPGMIKKSLLNIFGIFSTNIFRFNPILLIAWLASLPIFILNVIKRGLLNEIFLLFVLFFFFIQLIFINDYYYRKLVFLLPLVLLTIFVAIKSFSVVINNSKALLIYKIYLFVIIIFSLIIFIMNCMPRWIGKDAISDQKYYIITFFTFQFLILVFARKKINYRLISGVFIVLLISPSIYFSGRYIFISPTYTYKNTMKSISHYVEDNLMVGGMSTGFRLYSLYEPVIDGYGYKNTEAGRKYYSKLLDRILKEKGQKYTILYNSDGNLFCKENIVYDDKLDLVFVFTLNNTNDSIGLFKYRMN